MQKLVWQNSIGNEIDLTTNPYGITEWEGFANTSLNIQSQQVPFQDGGIFLDALMEQRELAVTLAMQDNNNLEARYRMRRELVHALNPKLGEGYLIYTNDFISKRIKCVPQIPLFETHNSNDSGTPKASLAWTACEPYWEDLEETEVINPQKIINEGDVEIGIKIEIQSTSQKPYIKNLTENKKIEYNGESSESPLYIDTNIGNKTVSQTMFDPSQMQLETISNIGMLMFSKYYRRYFAMFNYEENLYTLKSSIDGVIWEDVVTTKYARFGIYNELLILYANADSNEIGQKLYISRDLNTFQTIGTNLNDPDDEMTNIVIFPTYQDNFRIFVFCGSIYISTNIDTITTYINFTAKNLPLTYFRVYTLLYNPKLRTVFAISERNCYKYTNQEEWELTTDNLYDFLPYSTYIEETDIMVCFGSRYGEFSYSQDGVNWVTTQNEGGTGCTIYSVLYNAKNKCYIASGNDTGNGYIGISKDLYFWNSINGANVTTDGINIYSNETGKYLMLLNYEGYNVAITDLNFIQNRISKITQDSDLSLGLEVGDNLFSISDNTTCKVSYRQKYIGV